MSGFRRLPPRGAKFFQNKPIASLPPALRPAPRLRLRALRRPYGRPKPPFRALWPQLSPPAAFSHKTSPSRRRSPRCGRPLGCACGPSAGLTAAPSPLSGRFGRSFRRPPLFRTKQARRAVAARAAAGPSAAPAGPPPALRPPQAPFQGALAAAFAARRFFAQNKPVAPSQPALRPAPRLRLRALRRPYGRPKPPFRALWPQLSPPAAFSHKTSPSRRRSPRCGRPLGCACGPSAGLAAAPSPFQGALAAAFAARRFCAQNKPVAPSQPALRPAPRLRLRALRRPYGRPKPPFRALWPQLSPPAAFSHKTSPSRRRSPRCGRPLGCACGPSAGLTAAPSPLSGRFGRSFSPIAAFCAQNKPIAPGAAYSLSCFSSVLLLASGFFSFARSAVAVMPLASPKNTPAFMLPDMLPNTK